jgi:hypothetical protein
MEFKRNKTSEDKKIREVDTYWDCLASSGAEKREAQRQVVYRKGCMY